MDRIDKSEIYKWWKLFVAWKKNPLVEIRIIGRNVTGSGYFTDPDSIIDAIEKYENCNIYFTINSIPDCVVDRVQFGKIVEKTPSATTDKEIVKRDWVFLDIDVDRIKDINSTNEEAKYAKKIATEIKDYLRGKGFSEPVMTFSSNGIHLFYRCDINNTDQVKVGIENFVKSIALMFDDEKVKIDPVIYNAARIARLPGTMSGKGRKDSKDRPQRMCRILKFPETTTYNDISLFKNIATTVEEAEEEKPTPYNNWGRDKFDLRTFMQKHGIAVSQEVRAAGGTRYILEHCVFDHNHKAKDAMIFQYDSGAIVYKCLHASCERFKWKDVRLHFEPDAYSRQEYNDYIYKQRMQGRATPFVRHEETAEKGQIWLSLDAVPTIDIDSLEKIQTNIKPLDDKISGGTIMQQLSVLTGRPASGKSTFLDMMLLNSVNQGFPVALFSGELPNHLLKNWIVRPAAGYRVQCKDKEKEIYYVSKEIETKILQWLKGKLWIYNKEYGSDWGNLKKDIEDVIKLGARNIILDNLMTIDLDYQRDYEKSKAQIGLVKDLHEMVRQNNIHIWLVAHPRKQVNFLRYDDIAGASEIANLADNIFIVHRVNQDFENQAKAFFPKQVITDIMYAGYGNVIEIAKNRIPGSHIGELVGVYYDPKSKQMTGENGECLPYKWDESTPPPFLESAQEMKPNKEFELAPEPYYNQESRDIYNDEQDGELSF